MDLNYIDNLVVFERDLYYDMIAEAVQSEKSKNPSQGTSGDGGFAQYANEMKAKLANK
jgi:hypothetical protein